MLASTQLAAQLPEEIAGFQAQGPARTRTQLTPGSDAQLPTAARLYQRGETYLKLELLDSRNAPHVRDPIRSAVGLDEQSETASMRGVVLVDHPAMLQWTRANQTARASLMLQDRLVVNASVAPAPDTAEAEKVVTALDLAALEGLLNTLSGAAAGE